MESPWSVRYCTVSKCSGSTGIHHGSYAIVTVEYGNFYENVVHPERAVLYGWRSGLVVRFCILRNNTRDIFLHDSLAQAFLIQDCVFSSPVSDFPAGYTETDSTRNAFGTSTASIAIAHLATGYCETPLFSVTTALTPTCHFLIGVYRSATVIGQSYCVVIRNALFERTRTNGTGGAVCLDSASAPLFVQLATFLECHADQDGGAIHLASDCAIDDSCFIGTTAAGRGSALKLDAFVEASAIRHSLFANCGDIDTGVGCDATVYVSEDHSIEFSLLNFSDCCYQTTLTGRGRGFVCYFPHDVARPWSFRYSTVVRCRGATGLHHSYYADVTVEYCNFYDNVAHSNLGVLYAWKSGMIVKLSVFNGNSGDVVLELDAARRFQIVDCVFAAALPDGCFDESSAGNAFGVTTPSLPLSNLPSQACRDWAASTSYFTGPGCARRTGRSVFLATGFYLVLLTL
jgi:hypothetical protein